MRASVMKQAPPKAKSLKRSRSKMEAVLMVSPSAQKSPTIWSPQLDGKLTKKA